MPLYFYWTRKGEPYHHRSFDCDEGRRSLSLGATAFHGNKPLCPNCRDLLSRDGPENLTGIENVADQDASPDHGGAAGRSKGGA